MEFNTHLQEMVKINCENKILQIEKIFNLYEKHKLSLIGKITVIKTLAFPKIVYLLTTVPFPGGEIVRRLEKIFKHFIWKGNVKISLWKLEKNIDEGGLKLTNLICFHL